MRKYNVGEKIIIRGDIVAAIGQYQVNVLDDMLQHRRSVMTIEEIYQPDDDGQEVYELREDPQNWDWSADLFIPFPESEEELLKLYFNGEINEDDMKHYREMM